jgi:hypothetical protein
MLQISHALEKSSVTLSVGYLPGKTSIYSSIKVPSVVLYLLLKWMGLNVLIICVFWIGFEANIWRTFIDRDIVTSFLF